MGLAIAGLVERTVLLVRSFIDRATKAAGPGTGLDSIHYAGDAAILAFLEVEKAVTWILALHQDIQVQSSPAKWGAPIAFKCGVASGNVSRHPTEHSSWSIFGDTVARSIRLSILGRWGETVIDEQSLLGLSRPFRERLLAKCSFVEAERVEQHSLVESWRRGVSWLATDSAWQSPIEIKHRLRRLFETELRGDRVGLLAFLLDVPIDRRAPSGASLDEHIASIVDWAHDGGPSRIAAIAIELGLVLSRENDDALP